MIAQAAALDCGGAVVYAAGFGEGGGARLQAELVAAAGELPVVGPNCDGFVALHERAALWGDALARPEPGPVALVSQSGNLAVNALATRRGLRLHTAISSGNEAVLTHARLPRAPRRRAGRALGRAAARAATATARGCARRWRAAPTRASGSPC